MRACLATATGASKSPARAAERNASTTAHWRARSGLAAGMSARFTRCRARLASCLAAAGVRPSVGAIWSNGSSKLSWSTNASRSHSEGIGEYDKEGNGPRSRAGPASQKRFRPPLKSAYGAGCEQSGISSPPGFTPQIPLSWHARYPYIQEAP
jgi:hypothetical protein